MKRPKRTTKKATPEQPERKKRSFEFNTATLDKLREHLKQQPAHKRRPAQDIVEGMVEQYVERNCKGDA